MATKKTTKKAKSSTAATEKGAAAKTAKTAKASSRQPVKPAAKKKTSPKTKPKAASRAASPPPSGAEASPANLLARAEADLTALLESLNTQMAAAMHVFTELAAAQRGKHEAVIRTKPLDRATAMFQRLVTEIIDERFGEVLPMIVALRTEMAQRARMGESAGASDGDEHREFLTRGTEMLDQVLASAEVQPYEPNPGEAFDPLIHLAVGETFRDDLADDVVSEVFAPGFRSARGKVIQAARVKVNRR